MQHTFRKWKTNEVENHLIATETQTEKLRRGEGGGGGWTQEQKTASRKKLRTKTGRLK